MSADVWSRWLGNLDRHLAGPQERYFRDLLQFALFMQQSGDLEPWADLIRNLQAEESLHDEPTLWLVYLYNEYDSMSSAWRVFSRWPNPYLWRADPDRASVNTIPHMMERRNLHGGRGLLRCESYVKALRGAPQADWLRRGLAAGEPGANFLTMTRQLRQVWGVGRLAAFEWAEFLGKVMDWPLAAPHGQLWESSGPRESLSMLYSDPGPSPAHLEAYANHLRDWLAAAGAALAWEDFETVVCDFKVMRAGRYYPGKHLSALKGEIFELEGSDRERLLRVFDRMVPAPWRTIAPGIKKALLPRYKTEGRMVLPVAIPGFTLHEWD